MKIATDSHLDHDLGDAVIAYIVAEFKHINSGFIIRTIGIPEELGTVPCGIVGPVIGRPPVPEEDVVYVVRGTRSWPSRTLKVKPEKPQVRTVTVIAGPHGDDPCVLYTAYGGPYAPREPGDPDLKPEDYMDSRKFWSEHALIY